MNCPDCDAPLYNDGTSCKCGWLLHPQEQKTGEKIPLIMRGCAYCENGSSAIVNGWPVCGGKHFLAALRSIGPQRYAQMTNEERDQIE